MNIIRRRALKGALVATAVAVATATVAGTASAAPVAAPEPPVFEMYGVHKTTNDLYQWIPNTTGGFSAGIPLASDAGDIADIIVGDNDNDGFGEVEWTLYKDGQLDFFSFEGTDPDANNVGRGWNIYKTVLSPGSIGGAQQADLIGVDRAGVLWSYLSYPDGRLTTRTRVGGGWNAYNQIAGQGDLTGDGKVDIVARDTTGVLWLYKGTGNYRAPFTGRTKIGSGWNIYNRILSTGDINFDGKADLLARKADGKLFRYSGTGNAAAPFKAPVQINTGMQNFNLL
ncbi:N-acetylmuramoyl-L-alanine amidase [Streptomyces venezuelae]|uniref:FG-GAP repeat domain-containing protein n=1 Tax=Streptomyces gardneri TaxID=66892 RepID=UPI0006BC6DE1|nr:VCBS repeat-containing protein [Streptomyces gardneri]ALO09412.1 N-acetylmuramoyl-L-alanine amidase [Streptomyces venezuelae]QPK46519.1 VCBS repeat-containing protein [Streptomyces gardneri]WRK37908.1 VCBS repeat-containing protein [Streptomyces venezuelae]CUM40174.1 N-acetylmuramoyl-L-alanine amidase [Streptomyces venezuelae]